MERLCHLFPQPPPAVSVEVREEAWRILLQPRDTTLTMVPKTWGAQPTVRSRQRLDRVSKTRMKVGFISQLLAEMKPHLSHRRLDQAVWARQTLRKMLEAMQGGSHMGRMETILLWIAVVEASSLARLVSADITLQSTMLQTLGVAPGSSAKWTELMKRRSNIWVRRSIKTMSKLFRSSRGSHQRRRGIWTVSHQSVSWPRSTYRAMLASLTQSSHTRTETRLGITQRCQAHGGEVTSEAIMLGSWWLANKPPNFSLLPSATQQPIMITVVRISCTGASRLAPKIHLLTALFSTRRSLRSRSVRNRLRQIRRTPWEQLLKTEERINRIRLPFARLGGLKIMAMRRANRSSMLRNQHCSRLLTTTISIRRRIELHWLELVPKLA